MTTPGVPRPGVPQTEQPARVPVRASASPLAQARIFTIPRPLLKATVDVLAQAGRRGQEAFVVWGGLVRQGGVEVAFRSGLVPAQQAHQTHDGLLVTVEGSALFAVNRTLYSKGEILAAQVHSHPTDAYHSDTDDCFPLVTLTGALSVVVPDFGVAGLDDIRAWAWYRLTGAAQWDELTRADRVTIVDDVPED